MENLATELCIKIFRELDFKTKLNLTLVCRRFRDIIANSSDLLSDIKLTFDMMEVNWDEKIQRRSTDKTNLCLTSILESKRKYQNFVVKSHNQKVLKKVLTNFGCHLRTVDFIRFTTTKKEFLNILINLPLLEQAKFDMEFEKRSPQLLKFRTPICPNLKTLVLEGFESHDLNFYMELFNGSVKKLKSFEIKSAVSQYDPEELRNFLIDQRNLKSLKLFYLDISRLFATDICRDLYFQLEVLEIQSVQLEQQNIRNFLRFLIFQENLSHLKLVDGEDQRNLLHPDNLLTILLKLKKLKTANLNINNCNFDSLDQVFSCINPTIESLVFSSNDIHWQATISEMMLVDRIAKSMPNLQKLELDFIQTISSTDLMSLNQLQHLEELSVRIASQNAVKFLQLPILKKIVFNVFEDESFSANPDLSDSWIKFLKFHTNLEHFTFNCWAEFSEEIFETFFDQLKKLKHLEICLSETDTKAAEIISTNYKLLKDLEYIKVIFANPFFFETYEEIFNHIFVDREDFSHQTEEYLPYYERQILKRN